MSTVGCVERRVIDASARAPISSKRFLVEALKFHTDKNL